MDADPHRLALGPPRPAGISHLPDLLLLLAVHADHRVACRLVTPGLRGDVPELDVPVRVLATLGSLGVALQAEPLLVQQHVHRVRGDRVPLTGQLASQRPGRLDRPPQRRSRITPLIRIHQRQQRRDQPRIGLRQPLAAPARPPRPARRKRLGPRLQLPHPQRHRALPDPGRRGHQPDPPMTQRPRLRPQIQPPLPLIQMRQDHLELRRQHLPGYRHSAHHSSLTQTANRRFISRQILQVRCVIDQVRLAGQMGRYGIKRAIRRP